MTNTETGCRLKEGTTLQQDRPGRRPELSSGREDAAVTPQLAALLLEAAADRPGGHAFGSLGTADALAGAACGQVGIAIALEEDSSDVAGQA
jgi:hypothetical protein